MRGLKALVVGVAGLLTASLSVVAGPTAHACACGAFVGPEGSSVSLVREYVALSWDGTTQRMVLSMDALTEAEDIALLIPTPAPADVALAGPEVFGELEDLTAPETVTDYTWWPGWGADEAEPGSGAAGTDGVQVMETTLLGELEVSVLAADEADELTSWLDTNDYVMADGVADALGPYISEGWYFLGVRLTTDAADLSGALQPLDVTFASEQLIYPMRLSAAARDAQQVSTYVFSQERMERTDETVQTADAPTTVFAGPVSVTDFTADALVEMAQANPYLTVIEQHASIPSEDIVSDFTFGPSSQTADYRGTVVVARMREIGGLAAGPALSVIGMVVVLGGTLTAAGVARSRRRRAQREHAPA